MRRIGHYFIAILIMTLAVGCASRSDDTAAHAAKGGGAIPTQVGGPAPKRDASEPTFHPHPGDAKQAALLPMPTGQPAAQPLPDAVDLNTTREQLGAQALIAARSEVEGGVVTGVSISISDRHLFIYQSWLPQMLAKQEKMRAIAAARSAMAQSAVKESVRQAEWQRTMTKSDAEIDRQIATERAKPIPTIDD